MTESMTQTKDRRRLMARVIETLDELDLATLHAAITDLGWAWMVGTGWTDGGDSPEAPEPLGAHVYAFDETGMYVDQWWGEDTNSSDPTETVRSALREALDAVLWMDGDDDDQ